MAYKRKRRSRFAQKPWNKVTRAEKSWALTKFRFNEAPEETIIVDGIGNTQVVSFITAEALMQDPTGPGTAGTTQMNCKLHRIQGNIWCWLNPAQLLSEPLTASVNIAGSQAVTGVAGYANVAMLTYAWLKLSVTANSFHNTALAGSVSDYGMYPATDLAKMLMRDDLMKWDTIPVHGILPRNLIRRAWTATNTYLDSLDPLSGQSLFAGVAKIPYPRIPKGGLNLRKGEALVCLAAQWAGPGASDGADALTPYIDDPARTIVTYELSRCLISE